jgi:hypothetical protein
MQSSGCFIHTSPFSTSYTSTHMTLHIQGDYPLRVCGKTVRVDEYQNKKKGEAKE